MASNSYKPGMTWLPDDSAHGRAVPFGWEMLLIIEGFGTRIRNAGPRYAFAQSRIMPISRGSPPFYDS